MKLGFSYKFLFYLLLIVILAYISLEYFNVIEGNRPTPKRSKNVATGTRPKTYGSAPYDGYYLKSIASDAYEYWSENLNPACRENRGKTCAPSGNGPHITPSSKPTTKSPHRYPPPPPDYHSSPPLFP
jgi:hypothetical protein